MKSMNELIQEIGAQHTDVMQVDIEQTDMGEIIVVHLQPMEHPHILSMVISLPSEVVDQYDFQDAGAKWQAGLRRLGEHLKKQ